MKNISIFVLLAAFLAAIGCGGAAGPAPANETATPASAGADAMDNGTAEVAATEDAVAGEETAGAEDTADEVESEAAGSDEAATNDEAAAMEVAEEYVAAVKTGTREDLFAVTMAAEPMRMMAEGTTDEEWASFQTHLAGQEIVLDHAEVDGNTARVYRVGDDNPLLLERVDGSWLVRGTE